MGLFDNTSLDPALTPKTDIWPATLEEIGRRGLEIHGSLSQGKVDDGATAVVLKATEAASGRVVAVKVYKQPDQQVLHRNGDTIPMTNFFENERRMLAGLQSAAAIPRYFYSVDKDTALTGAEIQPFHVMEFIEGKRVTQFAKESLRGKTKGRVEELTELLQDVLRTIGSIHQFGYLHRDISDGNVLVDKSGNIRLIDLAEASPLGEQHTRLISTPGRGTDGTATESQRKVGYTLFTGRWKQTGETPEDWQRNLTNSGAPLPLAKILTKGMKPRDVNRQINPTVWNTTREVDTAISGYREGVRRRRRAVRWAMLTAVAAAFVLLVSALGYRQFQHQAYAWNLDRLNQERLLLAENPQKGDARVRQRVEKAQTLQSQAARLRTAGDDGGGIRALQQALDEIQQGRPTRGRPREDSAVTATLGGHVA